MIRKHIFVLIGILISQFVSSQELEVQRFMPNQMDLEAVINPVMDLNGNACALIKVAIAGEDVSFSGSIVGVPEKKNGEYHVYVPVGTKRLQIDRPMYLPLKIEFSDFNIKMESKMTYELRINTPTLVTRAQSDYSVPLVERQFVIINFTPVDAIVYIDDVPQITEGGRLERDLNCGMYSYKVEAPMYQTQYGSFTVEPSDKTELLIDLRAAFGYVEVNMIPEMKAKVYIDDVLCGTTPYTSDRLASGSHSLKLLKDGYYVFNQQFEVVSNKTSIINAHMKSSFSTIKLFPDSIFDQIKLDDKDLGAGVWEGKVDPGKHVLEVSRVDCQPQTMIIEVSEGESKTFNLPHLLPYLAVVSITTNPSEANIYIDDDLLGKSPIRTNKLSIGNHSVRIERDGYYSMSKDVLFSRNEENEFNFELIPINNQVLTDIKKQESVKSKKDSKSSKSEFLFNPIVSVVPKPVYGIRVGYVGRAKFGAYLQYKSNFNNKTASYDCSSDGKSVPDGFIWTSGNSVRTSLQLSAGGIMKASNILYMYAGLGMGKECLLWEDTSGDWAKVIDYSYEGLAISGGLMLRFGHFGVSMGANLTSFKYADMEFGLSVWF